MIIIIIIAIASSGGNDVTTTTTSSVAKRVTKSVIFCKAVDKDLKPTGVSNKFPVGSVTVELQSAEVFGIDKVKVAVYKID
ncbi:hypothetical protein [Clostridium estertheticum]|uniref:Uncharacterized protein n=1 Tax=Clostridium estertheticum TaxID=238834 RepID=A0AA47EF23_9CLOT|nr:hypothetical protein [Clostridium estertheticum]MBU3155007.1 hypothetical protein [Clostridium estertheticum]WAG58826.1 hypothetical protein LL038_14305 [Clostridium estertheticum]